MVCSLFTMNYIRLFPLFIFCINTKVKEVSLVGFYDGVLRRFNIIIIKWYAGV